jgi:hypothetical protein
LTALLRLRQQVAAAARLLHLHLSLHAGQHAAFTRLLWRGRVVPLRSWSTELPEFMLMYKVQFFSKN